MQKVCCYLGEQLGRYGFPDGHPFGPWRMQAFWQAMREHKLEKQVDICTPRLASQTELERFHQHAYVEQVKQQSQVGEGYLDYGDTPAFPGVYESASTVVGSCLDAVDRLLAGEYAAAFVPIAGLHHARRESAAGFCVFNDCGVVIETLLQHDHIHRVAYVDIDAHHGDGVYYGFETHPQVYIADLHEDGRYLYPGTGAANESGLGAAAGSKINIPLPPGADDETFFHAWHQVEDFLHQAEADVYILQCGVDSLADDPITHLKLSARCHYHAARQMLQLATASTPGGLLAVGGGGYAKHNIQRGWIAVVQGLLGLELDV